MKTDSDLLNEIIDAEGFADLDSFLECYAMDSIVPGICRICFDVSDCEPDARQNHCGACTANAIESSLSLAGMV